MDPKYIIDQFWSNFHLHEMEKLANPITSVPEMTGGDRVKLNMDMLEYLQNVQKAVYHGQPIPKVFGKVLIELSGLQDGSVRRYYVTFPEDKQNWVYIDLFVNWMHVAKVFYYNVQLGEENKFEDGRYFVYTPAIMSPKMKLPEALFKKLVSEARDIFTYTFLYVWANRENQAIFKEEEITDSNMPKGKHKNKKRHNKPTTPNFTVRDKVHVPKMRRIYTVREVGIPKYSSEHQSERNYYLSEWPVKGFIRKHTKKDGTVVEIPVRPHQRRRRKGNPKKDAVKAPGKDYILHERPLRKHADDSNSSPQ